MTGKDPFQFQDLILIYTRTNSCSCASARLSTKSCLRIKWDYHYTITWFFHYW